jgi:LacI family transcriptional regulator
VVNNDPNVKEATRQHVLYVIAQQGYRPNRAARALVTRKTRTLSLVIPQQVSFIFPDPYFPVLIQGVMDEASRQDYAVMLWMGSSSEEQESFYERVLANGLFDGVLVTSVRDDDVLIARLIDAGFPLMMMGRSSYLNPDHAFVDVDNQLGARTAVEHLLSLGYQRIGTITGPLNEAVGRHRLDGFRQAHRSRGIEPDPRLVIEGKFDEASGWHGMLTLLERGADAVFAASDTMAAGALRAARERGLCVPADVAVVGFDDLPLAANTTPPLTTVHQPVFELGISGVRRLIELIETGTVRTETQLVLPTHLVVRGSCGAALKRA